LRPPPPPTPQLSITGVDKDLQKLFSKYVNNQRSTSLPTSTLSLDEFVKQAVPKGINAAGKASITDLFTNENRPTYDHKVVKNLKYKPAYQCAPFGSDKEDKMKYMKSNHGATIDYLVRKR
jgi:hypothetical protein